MSPRTYFLRWLLVGAVFAVPIDVLLFLIWRKL